MALPQASKVAPVVKTSSIKRKCLLWSLSLKATSKRFSITDILPNKSFFTNNQPKRLINRNTIYLSSKSLLGPCYVHPQGTNLKNIKYNISKIIQDLKLDRQNISPNEKLQKVIDYIGFLS